MNRTKRILVAGAIALLMLWGCAPIDGPVESEESETPAASPDPASKPLPAVPKVAKKDLPPIPEGLRKRVEAAILNVRARSLSTTNSFWTVFHGILGLGPGTELTNPETGQKVNALDHICSGGQLRGIRFRPMILADGRGVEVITTGDGQGQGHTDQFISEMGQWSMPRDRKMIVDGTEYSYMDFVRYSQARALTIPNMELSWTLTVVAQYIGTNVSWTNIRNQPLHFDDIVRYELDQPVETAACGGTHRLFGLCWAYHLHLQKGGKTEGVWRGVPEKTARYSDLARQYQNSDGSLSTNFFRARGNAPDKNFRINSTGHIVEWLALALTDEELRQQWVQDAVNAVALQILDLQGDPIDSGSMYHAVHGLQIYYARVFDRSFRPNGKDLLIPKELLIPLPPGRKQV
jgi:hypothetical protein